MHDLIIGLGGGLEQLLLLKGGLPRRGASTLVELGALPPDPRAYAAGEKSSSDAGQCHHRMPHAR